MRRKWATDTEYAAQGKPLHFAPTPAPPLLAFLAPKDQKQKKGGKNACITVLNSGHSTINEGIALAHRSADLAWMP